MTILENLKSANAIQPQDRCFAKTRSGKHCQAWPIKGKRRCRMHGGTNPGPPKGNNNARKHGAYSAKAKAAARWLKAMARLVN